MKLKDIKGLLPKEKGYWDIQVKANGTIYGVGDVYNSARKEFFEREIEPDREKIQKIIEEEVNKGLYLEKDTQEIINMQVQALAQADIIKVKVRK